MITVNGDEIEDDPDYNSENEIRAMRIRCLELAIEWLMFVENYDANPIQFAQVNADFIETGKLPKDKNKDIMNIDNDRAH